MTKKETYFFPHDYEPTTDPKILSLLGEYGATGYGLYWRIIEMMHSDSSHKLPTKQYLINAIAKQMHSQPDFILNFINDCVNIFELFKQEGDMIFCDRVFRNISNRAEKTNTAKANAKARWDAVAMRNNATAMQSDAIKGKDIKGKEKKEEDKAIALLQKQKDFKKSCFPFVGEYPDEMVQAFCEYWSEANKSQTKIRWEIEKTFELPKRIARWAMNDKDFIAQKNKNTYQPPELVI